MKIGLQLSELSTYRTQLMGVATLMIIACHAPASHVLLPGVVSRVLDIGNYGVDIFLLLSGIGLFYSIQKKPVNTIKGGANYYKRRLLRIFIPYLLVYVPYASILLCLGHYSLTDCLLSWSALEFWFFHRGAWFVSLLIILYFLAPILIKLLNLPYKWLWTIALIAVITVLYKIPMEDSTPTNVLNNIQWAFGRTPSFILGIAIAQGCIDRKTVPVWIILLLALLGIIGWRFFTIGYCGAWMIVPFLVYLSIWMFKCLSKVTWFDKTMSFLGTISLESYLTNITLNGIIVIIIPKMISSPLFYGRYLEYLVVIILGLCMAVNVHKTVVKINKYI